MPEFNPHIVGSLTRCFDVSRKEVVGETLEQLRQNYFIAAIMHGSDDSCIGGQRINTAGRKSDSAEAKAKKDKAADDILFIAMLDQLDAMETDLTGKYGEDFAENWAADLLGEETYDRLMRIDDQDERREAIARAISKGIKDGTIDPSAVNENPDLAKWLELHDKIDQQRLALASSANSKVATHDISESSNLEEGFSSIFDANPIGR